MPLLTAESLKIQRGEGTNAKLILNGSSYCHFSIQAGQFYYLAGPSGVGKSTLLWALARMYPLIGGLLQFQGQSSEIIPIIRWRSEIALLPQSPVILPGTVTDNLLYPFLHFYIQKERLKEQHRLKPQSQELLKELEPVGLHDVPLEREAALLSGGQQVRLALIRLLLTKPQLILADEPTAGLDPLTAQQVLHRLQQFCDDGGAVILTSHVYGEQVNGTRILLNGDGTLQETGSFL